MENTKMTDLEMDQTCGGELTLASVMAVMSIGIVTVICYRLFKSGSGKTSLPGGFTFSWS